METRFKLPTKILSSFLAVLMAVSCFGIALPNLVPEASAAATTQDYYALKDAFDAVTEADGSINTGKYTVSSGENGEVLITDNTRDGSVFKLAEALDKIISAEAGGFKHNKLIRGRIKSVYEKNNGAGSYTSSMSDFVNLLLPISGDYASDSTSPKDGVKKLVAAGEPEAAYTKTLTSVVKVTRSESSVVLSYDDVNDVPKDLELTVVLTTVAEPKSEKKTFTDAAGQNWAYLVSWYENTSATVTHETQAAPDFAPLKKYMSYIKSASFAPYYEQFVKDATSVYTFTEDVVEDLSAHYADYNTAGVYGLASDYLDKFLATGEGENYKTGNAAKTSYDSFIANVTKAAPAVENRKFVDWVMKGTSVKGQIDRDAYLPHADSQGNVVEPDKDTVGKLYEQAKLIRDILNDSTNNNIYVSQYGYKNGEAEALVQKIYVAYQHFTLDKIFKNIVFRMENTSDKYFDDELSYFGLADYDSSKYATGEMPITDEMLAAAIEWLDTQFTTIDDDELYDAAGRDAAVAAAGSSTITKYSQVQDFYNKLVAELKSENRKQDNEYIETYHKYFDSFIKDAASLDTVYMANAYATGIDEKAAECRAAYNAAVTKLGKAAADKIFGNINNRVTLAKNAILSAMQNRLLAQCRLMETYANNANITEANFSLVKAQYGNINNAIIPATVDGKETTISLYQWCKNHGYSGADSIYNKYETVYKVNVFIARRFCALVRAFRHRKIHISANGVYSAVRAGYHNYGNVRVSVSYGFIKRVMSFGVMHRTRGVMVVI